MSRRQPKPALFLPNGRPVGQKVIVKPVLGPDSKPLPASEASKKADSEALMKVAGLPRSIFAFYDQMADDIMRKRTDNALYGGFAARRYPRASYMGIDLGVGDVPTTPNMPTTDWRGHVADQVEAVLRDKHWQGKSDVAELPKPQPDLTTYADAFAAAAASCQHRNYEDTMYAKREARCNDCGRYFKKQSGLFGW